MEPFDRKEDLPLRAIPEEINIKMNDLQGTVTSFVGKLNNLTTHINILQQRSDLVGSQLLKQHSFNSMEGEVEQTAVKLINEPS